MEELKKMYEKYGVKYEKPKRKNPKLFEERQFDNKESFRQYIIDKNYCISKEEGPLIFLSKLDRRYLSISIFKKEEETFVRVAFITSIYYYETQILDISLLIVKPEERGKGFGSLLYKYFEKESIKIFEIKSINGSLLFWTENEQRENFYKKLGFYVFSDDKIKILNKIKKEIK